METENAGQPSEPLLRHFDKTAELLHSFVVERYGEEVADALYQDARKEFEHIIPQIPRIHGIRARLLNTFLQITGQEVAVYKAVRKRGGDPADAWELCHEGIRLRMKEFPPRKRALLRRLMFSGIVRRVVSRREAKNQQLRLGDFEIRYLAGNRTDFDIGVDYVGCGCLELAKKLDAEDFAPYVCMSDIALSDGLGWGLIRTQTLADGCDHCDFRFKKDGETRVTSQTLAVQETIDRIARRSVSA